MELLNVSITETYEYDGEIILCEINIKPRLNDPRWFYNQNKWPQFQYELQRVLDKSRPLSDTQSVKGTFNLDVNIAVKYRLSKKQRNKDMQTKDYLGEQISRVLMCCIEDNEEHQINNSNKSIENWQLLAYLPECSNDKSILVKETGLMDPESELNFSPPNPPKYRQMGVTEKNSKKRKQKVDNAKIIGIKGQKLLMQQSISEKRPETYEERVCNYEEDFSQIDDKKVLRHTSRNMKVTERFTISNFKSRRAPRKVSITKEKLLISRALTIENEKTTVFETSITNQSRKRRTEQPKTSNPTEAEQLEDLNPLVHLKQSHDTTNNLKVKTSTDSILNGISNLSLRTKRIKKNKIFETSITKQNRKRKTKQPNPSIAVEGKQLEDLNPIVQPKQSNDLPNYNQNLKIEEKQLGHLSPLVQLDQSNPKIKVKTSTDLILDTSSNLTPNAKKNRERKTKVKKVASKMEVDCKNNPFEKLQMLTSKSKAFSSKIKESTESNVLTNVHLTDGYSDMMLDAPRNLQNEAKSRNRIPKEKIEPTNVLMKAESKNESLKNTHSTKSSKEWNSPTATTANTTSQIKLLTESNKSTLVGCYKPTENPPKILNLNRLNINDVLHTFTRFKPEIDKIFDDVSKKGFIHIYNDLCAGSITELLDVEIQIKMLYKLADVYQGLPSATHASHFCKAVLPSWILLVFMNEHNMTREQALDHIKRQKKYIDYERTQAFTAAFNSSLSSVYNVFP